MKRHGHILHRFSIKGRLENADPTTPDDKELEEVIAAKLLQETVDTDGVKRYWLTHAGKTYLKSEKELYKKFNALEMLRQEIKMNFLGGIFVNPLNSILTFIGLIIVIMWGLSWGVYEVITFFASVMDWFDAAIMSLADWMVDNFGGWIEVWL